MATRDHIPATATLRRWQLVGAISSVVVVVGAYIGRVDPHGANFGHVGGRSGAAIGSAIVYLGVAGLSVAWLMLGRRLATGGLTDRDVLRTGVLWGAPLIVAPALFSHDLHSYAAQGALVLAGLNPYHHTTTELPSGAIRHAVDPIWQHTPSPYGPLFLLFSAAVVHTFRPMGTIVLGLVFRLLAVLGVVLAARSIPRLARASGIDPARALWIAILNPLTLLHFVGGGHNDALMVGLLLVGLAFDVDGRTYPAIVLCALAGMIKAPALLGAAYVGLRPRADETTGRDRLVGVARRGAVAVLTVGAVTGVSGLGTGWIGALSSTSGHTLLTPTILVQRFIVDAGHFVGVSTSSASVLHWVRRIGFVTSAVILLRLALRPASSAGHTTACAL